MWLSQFGRQRAWWLRGRLALREWDGRSPAPSPIKQRVIRGYGRHFRLKSLVETGTFRGEMIAAARWWFDEIHTIELDPSLAEMARRRFRLWQRIHVYEGDSATLLPLVLDALSGPALFWLDAHYSAGATAGEGKDAPVEEELDLVVRHPLARVVLVDDARYFGQRGYPSLARVEEITRSAGKSMQVDLDIIRIA